MLLQTMDDFVLQFAVFQADQEATNQPAVIIFRMLFGFRVIQSHILVERQLTTRDEYWSGGSDLLGNAICAESLHLNARFDAWWLVKHRNFFARRMELDSSLKFCA